MIDRDDVIAGYRLILGREPENEAAIQNHMRARDLQELRWTFIRSPEFRRDPLSRRVVSPPWVSRMLRRVMRNAGRRRVRIEECDFYHSMTFPDGSEVTGVWDLRTCFSDYIGGINLHGKTVLDVGTASGFVAFQCEKRGAMVTAHDMKSNSSAPHVPFASSPYYNKYDDWLRDIDVSLARMHNGFWYAHDKFDSRVKVIHAPLSSLPRLIPPHDIVIAGAVIEHVSDPISAIGHLSKLAKETLVLASTPVIEAEDLLMKAITTLNEPQYDYTWFAMSTGLLRRVLENVEFRVTKIGSSRHFFVPQKAWADRPVLVILPAG